MKRISSFFPSAAPVNKQFKQEVVEDNVNITQTIQTTVSEQACVGDHGDVNIDSDSDLPSCWTLEQKIDFCGRFEWLCVRRKKLGCTVCRKVGTLGIEAKMGMKISKEWTDGTVSCYGDEKNKQQNSLRKKMLLHQESAGHQAAVNIVAEAEKEKLESVVLKSLTREKTVTAKNFCTAYKVAKGNQSFNNFEMEIDSQELNGIDMGRILHSTNSCINIVNHISTEMRQKLVKEVVDSKSKISVMIDESTTLSKKSTLIVYLRSCIEGTEMKEPINLFLDLVELQSVTTNGIFTALLDCLKYFGIGEEYLKNYLVSVTCDGASVMLGCRSGVKKLLTDKFPSVIIWHCANHRLELSVADTVKDVSGINRFKAFLDKLYVIYHASQKNSRELHSCAELLEVELLKIGRVLSIF